LYGPCMNMQPELLRFFTESGAGVQIEGDDLGPMVRRLLQDPDERQRLGKLAFETIELNRGSAQRHMRVLKRVLASPKRQP
jgi:3-deoxy-D-manno-octulosonic-acid transferase